MQKKPSSLCRPACYAAMCSNGGVSGVSHDKSNIFVKLKKEHNIAKAVKSDDAQVFVRSWDYRVCRGEPTGEQVKALGKLRELEFQRY